MPRRGGVKTKSIRKGVIDARTFTMKRSIQVELEDIKSLMESVDAHLAQRALEKKLNADANRAVPIKRPIPTLTDTDSDSDIDDLDVPSPPSPQEPPQEPSPEQSPPNQEHQQEHPKVHKYSFDEFMSGKSQPVMGEVNVIHSVPGDNTVIVIPKNKLKKEPSQEQSPPAPAPPPQEQKQEKKTPALKDFVKKVDDRYIWVGHVPE